MVYHMSSQSIISHVSCCLLCSTHGPICDKRMRYSDMNFQVYRIQDGVWIQAGYICSIYLECVRCVRILPAVMRCLIEEEGNAIYPTPCWRSKSIPKISPSYDGPYLTAVWMVLTRPAQGRPYFTMGAVIT